jgi:hypothetical protein
MSIGNPATIASMCDLSHPWRHNAANEVFGKSGSDTSGTIFLQRLNRLNGMKNGARGVRP